MNGIIKKFNFLKNKFNDNNFYQIDNVGEFLNYGGKKNLKSELIFYNISKNTFLKNTFNFMFSLKKILPEMNIYAHKFKNNKELFTFYYYNTQLENNNLKAKDIINIFANFIDIPYNLKNIDIDYKFIKKNNLPHNKKLKYCICIDVNENFKVDNIVIEIESFYKNYLKDQTIWHSYEIDKNLNIIKENQYLDFHKHKKNLFFKHVKNELGNVSNYEEIFLNDELKPIFYSFCIKKGKKLYGIYYENIKINNLIHFLKKLNHNKKIINFLEKNKNNLKFYYFSVALDFFIKNNKIVIKNYQYTSTF